MGRLGFIDRVESLVLFLGLFIFCNFFVLSIFNLDRVFLGFFRERRFEGRVRRYGVLGTSYSFCFLKGRFVCVGGYDCLFGGV